MSCLFCLRLPTFPLSPSTTRLCSLLASHISTATTPTPRPASPCLPSPFDHRSGANERRYARLPSTQGQLTTERCSRSPRSTSSKSITTSFCLRRRPRRLRTRNSTTSISRSFSCSSREYCFAFRSFVCLRFVVRYISSFVRSTLFVYLSVFTSACFPFVSCLAPRCLGSVSPLLSSPRPSLPSPTPPRPLARPAHPPARQFPSPGSANAQQ